MLVNQWRCAWRSTPFPMYISVILNLYRLSRSMGRARENCRITCKIHGLIYGEPQRLNHECVHIVTSVAENRSLKVSKFNPQAML